MTLCFHFRNIFIRILKKTRIKAPILFCHFVFINVENKTAFEKSHVNKTKEKTRKMSKRSIIVFGFLVDWTYGVVVGV